MAICAGCKREISGRHPDVLTCVAIASEPTRIYGLTCCAMREVPWAFAWGQRLGMRLGLEPPR